MRFETTTYTTGTNWVEYYRIRDELPDWVTRELVQDPRLTTGVCIETRKSDIVEYMERSFRVQESFDCMRNDAVEIDRAEIPCFSYFWINPRQLSLGTHIKGVLMPPTCDTEACPEGAKLLSPILVAEKSCTNLGIAEVERPWQRGADLIVSSDLKDLFEAEGISGMTYEQCEVAAAKGSTKYVGKAPYLARIGPQGADRAKDMHLEKYFCEKHSIIGGGTIRNPFTPLEDLAHADFQIIDKLLCRGKTYYYRSPGFIVSRRVLELLLEHKIPRLSKMGFFLGKRFLPVVTTPLTYPAPSPRPRLPAQSANAKRMHATRNK